MSTAVSFEHVTTRFTLEHERPRSFQEALIALARGQSSRTTEPLLALDDVSFVLEHGGTLGLVGPNGTGKSTLLKLIARILEPNHGRVRVDGRVAALLEVGTGFHPDLSGRENIYLNGSMMGLSRREMGLRFDQIVAFSELERFIDMPVKHYSSGMYMRLGFATAIHLEAEILLVDEVLAVGDQAFQNKCRDRIAELRKAGITILLVSHDATAVRELCTAALWLEEGQVKAMGATDGVLEAYNASVVAREEARFAAEHGSAPAAAEAAALRWGSHEVEITGVDFLGADGTPHHILDTDRPATLRIRYVAHQPIERPVFGLAIYRNDGLHLNGPNTQDAELAIPSILGTGHVDYRLERVTLLPGTYEVSVSVYDQTCTHPYDFHNRRFTFRVRAGHVRERYGLLSLPAHWSHASDASAPER
jgi:lipopolysaccharide transport system ATP-binding protein